MDNIKVNIFGTCRVSFLYRMYSASVINKDISHTTTTKEMLEVIKFCKYGHLKPEETLYSFMWPIQNKIPTILTEELKRDFETSNVSFLEISSKTVYQYNDIYISRYIHYPDYNTDLRHIEPHVTKRLQEKDEIEQGIVNLIKELGKNIVIVSHMVTYERGERYRLAQWLEEICLKYNILFINPIRELKNRGYNIEDCLEVGEPVVGHYSKPFGEEAIMKIYQEYMEKLVADRQVSVKAYDHYISLIGNYEKLLKEK
jgi:hypothetical protein